MPYIKDLQSAGGEVYEVGGSVRDRLLKQNIKDRDLLVTNLSIDTISKTLKPYGRVTFVGKSFGVIKFYPNQLEETTIDIAIPRKEVSTGTGHKDFEVKYDPHLPVEIDLGRRDFTVNAMALRLRDKIIIDPYGGQKDLKELVLRQVFDETFKEDPLRLLRAIQFSARFSLTIEPVTKAAMTQNAHLIKTVQSERIIEEIKKLMTANKPSDGFRKMSEIGLLSHVLPALEATIGISQAKQSGDDVFSHTMKVLDASRADPAIDNSEISN